MYLYAAGIGCKIQAHYKSTNNSRARELCDKTFTEECKFMGKEFCESRAARRGIHAIPYPQIYTPQYYMQH